jgi:hypothetical protein
MRRVAVLGTLICALSVSALVIGVSRAAADWCTFGGGGTEACVYFDGQTGGSADMPPNHSVVSIYNYWFTNKMWRPTPNYASIYWTNSAGLQDPFSCVNCNPLRRAGSWGYDRAWCSNLEDWYVGPTKCQVFNWNA